MMKKAQRLLSKAEVSYSNGFTNQNLILKVIAFIRIYKKLFDKMPKSLNKWPNAQTPFALRKMRADASSFPAC
jgi:hypothetical protein